MNRSPFLLAALAPAALLIALGGCAPFTPQTPATLLVQVADISTGALQTRAAVAQIDGEPALLFASKDNRVVFQHGAKRVTLDDSAPVRGGNRFQLQREGEQLHALWWSHQDAKNLYFTSSANGGQAFAPVSIVNDAHGVLGPFSLLRGPEGVLGMGYGDERLPKYQAFFNRSTDGGRTWARPDQRLDTPPPEGRASDVHDPQSVESGTAWVSAWVDDEKVGDRVTYRIVSRRSDDFGLTWSAPQVLHRSDKLLSSLVLRAQGAQVVIAADEDKLGVVAVASSDHGLSWREAGVLAGSEGASNSGIDMALAGARAHLVWMQDRSGAKTTIQRASLDLAQAHWAGPAQRLDMKAHDNTRSVLPVLLAQPDGPVLAAWVDYRDIRPNIYLSATFDGGQAWSAPQALLQPASVSAGLPQLLPWGADVAIGYETYPADRAVDGNFILRLIPLQAAKALPDFGTTRAQPTEAERKARLAERVKALWDNRVAANYEPTYDMFDFAYKASTPKKHYLDSVGVITYLSYSIDELSINGNEASAKMKIRYEVKPTPLPSSGKLIRVEPVDVEATNTWVWVGNDWYLMFAPAMGQPNLKY